MIGDDDALPSMLALAPAVVQSIGTKLTFARLGPSGHEHREIPGCERVDHRRIHHQRHRRGGQTAVAVAVTLRYERRVAAEEIAGLIGQNRTPASRVSAMQQGVIGVKI